MSLIEKFEKKKYEMAKQFIKEGKKSKGLRYLAEDIFLLWQKGLNKKEILEIINQELGTNIKFKTFESFFSRHIKKMTISNTTTNNTTANAVAGKKTLETNSTTPNQSPKDEKKTKFEKKDIESTNKNQKKEEKNVDIEEMMNKDIDISEFLPDSYK
ncbi:MULTISPECIES: hypothetical protein [unclassified Nitratiruptor]|uniref:hypothetical protein n=1 Tax=unclassified Nitratiruptor TaxID=2624044 RepID=UPI0018EAF1D8|nr:MULTISPECIES: hypothetical protein [unclassified Nitratiruptor]BCD61141.1 hypothetical protein NitYY0810_P03 [Nitratiruptor sp. YY08-10]BCD65074.1 hypothetical protein NitYY0814_P03 [Nitratiruptor sp. YY08-14]